MYDSCYPWAENSQNSRSSRPASSVSRLYCLTFSPLSHAFIHSCYPLPSERSTVSMADCSNGGAAIARGSGILGLRHQARSGSDRSSCQSQNLCPCCQIRVLLGGQQIGGGGVSFPECWCGRIKIGDVGKHNQERGVIVVLNHGYTFMNPPFIFLQCSSPHC